MKFITQISHQLLLQFPHFAFMLISHDYIMIDNKRHSYVLMAQAVRPMMIPTGKKEIQSSL